MTWLWWTAGSLGFVLAFFLVWGAVLTLQQRSHIKTAIPAFFPQREHLEAQFLQAASRLGKPRGLLWKSCDWDDQVVFAREVLSGKLNALVAVTIHFEAVEGGDMEGVEAVSLPRNASAVFFYEKGRWKTSGKAVFNLNPAEALDHFKGQYQPLESRP
jgi:hypothetical protein